MEVYPKHRVIGLQSVESSCSGKHMFDTFEAAQKVQRKQRKSRNSHRMNVYHCTFCGKYHLGSADKYK